MYLAGSKYTANSNATLYAVWASTLTNYLTAVYNSTNHTLKFYNRVGVSGMTVPLESSSTSDIPWYSYRASITGVYFDESFYSMDNVKSMAYWFSGFSSLTSIDLSGLATKAVTNMRYMFSNCTSLTTIYADGSWSTKAVTDSTNMFYNDSNLVGGSGTTYNSSNITATYAHIDKSSNPGYFTNVSAMPIKAFRLADKTLVFAQTSDPLVVGDSFSGSTISAIYPAPTNAASINDVPWHSDVVNIQTVNVKDSVARYTELLSLCYWFSLNYCTACDGLGLFNTSKVTNFS